MTASPHAENAAEDNACDVAARVSGDLAADLRLAREVTRAAGVIALTYFGKDPRHWNKGGDLGPVSEADLAIDDALKQALTGARPDYGWLSEETADDPARLERRRVWVIDPIDGTRAFLRGEPSFTICVGLVEDGVPIAGVVLNPATGDCYEAAAGGGAALNGRRLRGPARQRDLAGARVLGVGAQMRDKRWRGLWPEMEVGYFNSIALRLCLVSGGGWDACVSLSAKHEWDVAAADVIAREAGAEMTDPTGAALRYNKPKPTTPGVINAPAELRAELIAIIARGPDAPSGAGAGAGAGAPRR